MATVSAGSTRVPALGCCAVTTPAVGRGMAGSAATATTRAVKARSCASLTSSPISAGTSTFS
ncbi:hypothetical protein CFP66_38355 [Pseudonocardia sp. MH-G8]|nr:hypothetical protein CFP66_38355 [Pseudonocardia sp. MH-G8]